MTWKRRLYTDEEKTELLTFDSRGPRGWAPLIEKTGRSQTSLEQTRWKLRRAEADRAFDARQPGGQQGEPRRAKPTSEDRAKRECLKCREMFMSDWIGNRMCPPCLVYAGNHSSSANVGHTIEGRV